MVKRRNDEKHPFFLWFYHQTWGFMVLQGKTSTKLILNNPVHQCCCNILTRNQWPYVLSSRLWVQQSSGRHPVRFYHWHGMFFSSIILPISWKRTEQPCVLTILHLRCILFSRRLSKVSCNNLKSTLGTLRMPRVWSFCLLLSKMSFNLINMFLFPSQMWRTKPFSIPNLVQQMDTNGLCVCVCFFQLKS